MNEPSPQAAAGAAPRKRTGPLGVLLAGLAVAASKAKFLLVGLKFLPFGKLALTSLTMLTSIWLYARVFGFSFAVGFVLLILLHELGHGAAMKMVGVKAGWPIFIPFFGAAISLKSMPRSAHDHAVIAYGGPLAGTAAMRTPRMTFQNFAMRPILASFNAPRPTPPAMSPASPYSATLSVLPLKSS